MKTEEIKWELPEILEIEPHWLNKDRNYYIRCQFAEQKWYKTFQIDPYHFRSLYLIKILPAFSYNVEKYAIIEEWRQEGHPSYADCLQQTVYEFDNLETAVREFDKKAIEIFC